MKKFTILLITMASLLSGCVAYEVEPNRSASVHQRDHDRDGTAHRSDRDRDGDGVRNSQDRRPDDARRY
jgi:hypothetical protein